MTLFPIKWREPYGLIPVESMATGTPAISFACGGAAETVADGKVGFLVEPNGEDLEPKAHVKGLDLKIKKKGVDGLVEGVKEIEKLRNEEMKKLRTVYASSLVALPFWIWRSNCPHSGFLLIVKTRFQPSAALLVFADPFQVLLS